MTAPPIIANTDFSQWQTWQKVTAPGGNDAYFVVPGYGGKYVYDPYTSAATGKLTLFENPQSYYEAAEAQKKAEEDANSLGAQLAVPAGAIVGTVGADYVAGLFDGSEVAAQVATPATGIAGTAGVGGQAPTIVSAARTPGEIAAGGAQPGTFDAGGPIGSNIGTVAQGALGAAGLALGAKGVYDSFEAGDPLGGAISGASAGAGGLALAGSLGAATGGLALPIIGAAALLGGAAGLFGDRETGREQIQKRLQGLQKKGVNVPNANAYVQDYGLEKEDLVAREQQKVQQGLYGNPKFAASRDEKDLRPEDTWGGLMWFEEFGNDYLGNTTEEQRRAMNQLALDKGLIKEGRGQLSFTDNKAAREIYQQVVSGVSEEEGKKEDAPGTGSGVGTQLQQVDPAVLNKATPQTRPTTQSGGDTFSQVDLANLSEEQRAALLAKLMDGTAPLGTGAQPGLFR